MEIYVSLLIQVALIVHVLKTGRSRYWILVLFFIPLFGALAYVLIEILPEFRQSIAGQRALRGIKHAVDPGGEVRKQAAAWEQSPNADNARRYAEALLGSGQAEPALELLGKALSGLFKTEPNLLLLRARAEFELERSDNATATLHELKRANPEFKSPDGHLLLARALEASGNLDAAISEYRSISTYYPGAEARYRLGKALQKGGRNEEARRELEQMIRDADLAPAHFRKSQKQWLNAARKALS